MPAAEEGERLRFQEAEALESLQECEDCGLFQRVSELQDGDSAYCSRCNCRLRRSYRHGLELPLACGCIAAVLFALTLGSPILSLHTLGRFATADVLSGPRRLIALGPWLLALLVLATLIIMPALRLAVTLIALTAARLSWRSPLVAWSFASAPRIAPWSMVEVFLLGAAVAYTRLSDMAEVEIGPSLYAAAGFVVSVALTESAIDRELVWQRIAGVSPERRAADASAPILGCDTCGRVARAWIGERCARCDHPLVHRKPDSIARVWACVVAATILLLPANLLPVMTIVRAGQGGPRTILGGVIELADDRLWVLATIVFVASVAVPLLKLATLIAMLVMTALRSSAALRLRTRLYRLLRLIGRWSMIDIFMLTTLVGLLHMGALSTVLPEDGALAFATVVALTMFATEWLDPRLMWDAAQARGASE